MRGMKYWRVIRFYFQHTYGISQQELELMMFLYDEKYFTRKTFNEYAFLMRWHRMWFNDLVDRGHIVSHGKKTFTLSKTSRAMVAQLHEILEGKVLIPQDPEQNPLFRPYPEIGYTENKYRKMIMRMNEEVRGRPTKIRGYGHPYD